MAVYVTKKCPHCGYKYQRFQSGDQRKYGYPYLTCEKCKNSFWDDDIKEPALYGYENMHEKIERIKTVNSAVLTFVMSVGLFLVGLFMLIKGSLAGVFLILFSCGFVYMIIDFIRQKAYTEEHRDEIIAKQQADYDASIERLKNKNYLEALAKRDKLANKLLQQRINGETEIYADRPEGCFNEKDNLCSKSDTEKYYHAYSKIIDYIDETSDCLVDDTKLNYIYDCLYLCSAWCVFHANKDKKEQVESLRQRLLQKADELNLSVEKITDDYDAFNAHMLNYKKEVIDPEYLKDSSVENYDKLISVFVKEILNITDIKYYPEIFTDFLSCMK